MASNNFPGNGRTTPLSSMLSNNASLNMGKPAANGDAVEQFFSVLC
jgi:hypothetical protein